MNKSKLGQAIPAFARQKDRLDEDRSFKIFTLLIPFMAVAVLTIYTSFETATRLYGVAQPLEHNSPTSDHYGVWLSVGLRDGGIVITTINGNAFSWPLSGPSNDQLDHLRDFLRESGRTVVEKSVLKGQMTASDSLVALSVDQRLNFHHIRPVLYALADAGFTRYGFETRVLR